jgi:hypothetical protein
MAKIINLMERLEKDQDNLIIRKPWEFRRAFWQNKYFVQMQKFHSIRLERHRKEINLGGSIRSQDLPPHIILKNGLAHTIQNIYLSRHNEVKMRETYYLAGLIDCMINQVNPLLRTGYIADIYQKVTTLKKILNIRWYGDMDQVLFPLGVEFFNLLQYQEQLKEAKTMKALYSQIRQGTNEMFDILSSQYTFYVPGRG